MVDATNLKLRNQPTNKLRQRLIGPYPIIKVLSPVPYELQLP